MVLSGNAMPHGSPSPVFIGGTESAEEGSVDDYEIQEARKQIASLNMASPLLGRSCVSRHRARGISSNGFRRDAVNRRRYNKIYFCVVLLCT